MAIRSWFSDGEEGPNSVMNPAVQRVTVSAFAWRLIKSAGPALSHIALQSFMMHIPLQIASSFPNHQLGSPLSDHASSASAAALRLYFVLAFSHVLGPSLQEGLCGTGARPKKSSEAHEGSRAQVSWGAAEGTGVVQSGEKQAEGRPYCSLQLPERRL